MAATPLNPSMGGQAQIPFGGTPVNTGAGSVPSATPTMPSTNPGQVTANNPFAAPGAAPVGGAVPTAGPTNTGAINGSAPSGTQSLTAIDPNYYNGSSNNTVAGGLNQTYGAGIGTGVADILANMGSVSDSAIQATIANTDLAAGQQYSNIQSQEAASGVTANSSTAALAAGDFYSNVNSQLQQTIGQQEVSEENTALSTLTTAGQEHGPNPSTFDSIMSDIGSIF